VYSLGTTAYWLLAGQPPVNLTGVKGTAARMAAAAAQATPRLREVAPHVPASVASIIDRAMAIDPADRFQTVAEFSAALGSRTTKTRRWRRTNEHAGHLGCWRGERPAKSTYILCLEEGATPKQCTVTTRYSTGARVPKGSRTAPMRDAAPGRPRDDRQALVTTGARSRPPRSPRLPMPPATEQTAGEGFGGLAIKLQLAGCPPHGHNSVQID
jgi:hypothetical protein